MLQKTFFAAAICALGCLNACKQGKSVRIESEVRETESLSLSAPLEVTGSIALLPIKNISESQFQKFGLIECNSPNLSVAEEAIRRLEQAGANLAADGRGIETSSLSKKVRIDCHLLHAQSFVDSKSITLLNERIRGFSGLRQASRSDLAIYESAQLIWVAMQSAAKFHESELSDEILIGEASQSQHAQLRQATFERVLKNADIYSPCANAPATSPRWIADEPALRERQFVCENGTIKLRIDANRPYAAVRNTLRSGIVALFQESRGMHPTSEGSRPDSRFAISALQHSLTN